MLGSAGGRNRALATMSAPWSTARPAGRDGGGIGGQRDIGVQQRDEGREVAAAGRGEERGGHLPLAGEVGGAIRAGRTAYPATGPAGELPRRVGRAPEHGRHLGERHREHVVQHEREPLGRA